MAISQKHRSRLRIQGVDLAHPIIFLVRAGKLVLADAIAVVVGHGSHSHEAGLRMCSHHQAVEVVAGLQIAAQNALRGHALQIFRAFGVYGRRIGVGARGQVNLWLGDMQKTPRPPLRPFARLGAAQHVIGGSRDRLGVFGGRAQAGEGTNQGHAGLPELAKRAL